MKTGTKELRQIISSIIIYLSVSTVFGQNTYPENRADQIFSYGIELHQKGFYQASRKIFDNYLRQYPDGHDAAEAKYFVAFNAINNGDKDGEYLMTEFIENNPGHHRSLTAYFDLGEYYYNTGDYNKGINSFEKVDFSTMSFAKSIEGHFKLGYCYFMINQYDKALNSFEPVMQLQNDFYGDANYYSGFISYSRSNYLEALAKLGKVKSDAAYKDELPELLAASYLALEQYRQLISYTEPLISSKDATPQLVIMAAEGHYNLKNYQQAADLYAQALNSSKRKATPLVYFHHGHCDYILGKDELAVESFKNAGLTTDTLGQYASYYLGQLYNRLDNKPFASNAFETASRMDYNPTIKEESRFRVGQLQYEQGQFTEAISTFQSFVNDYPNSVFRGQTNDLLGDAFLKTNNYDLAISYIESLRQKSEAIRKTYQHVTLLKGSQLFNDRQFETAILYFNKSLSAPTDPALAIEANFWNGEAYSIGKKWPEAITSFSKIVFPTSNNISPFYLKARYGLGYSYYNSKVYSRAKIQFAEYTKGLEFEKDKQYMLDGLVRLADCYFIEKNYNGAINNYEKSLSLGSSDKAYIFLQLGLSYGFSNKINEAKQNFRRVITGFPKTPLAERSAYQMAQLDFENGNFQAAINEFSYFISNYHQSSLLPNAYVKRALTHYNLQNYQQTADDYQTVIDRFGSHAVARSALLGLQEVAAIIGGGVDVDSYIEKYRRLNPSDGSIENIEFESAKGRYFAQDYGACIDKLIVFLRAYPESSFKGEAVYFIADSYYRQGDNVGALGFFKRVLDYPQLTYYNRAVQRIGLLEYELGNYSRSITHYKQLLGVAKNKRETYNAREGLMQAYYKSGKYDSTEMVAIQILSETQVGVDAQSIANLFLGKAALKTNRLEVAQDYFEKTRGVTTDENAAEATYLIAEILSRQSQYSESNDMLFEVNRNYSIYEEWLGRSFLLIADNYIATDELFQAKATLNSIIENSPLDDIKRIAKEKLLVIEGMENNVLENNVPDN
ncbi:MAG: tetratricopeptide repeat protein [Bacteroidetes bacterium]|nr:tetratricopeptide repeat protein [Bacteroidota bacterium]MDA1121381.1 tetratricopeptide repeat protein [Bacteroidota bacterium]